MPGSIPAIVPGAARETVTDQDGRFVFGDIEPGSYSVRTELEERRRLDQELPRPPSPNDQLALLVLRQELTRDRRGGGLLRELAAATPALAEPLGAVWQDRSAAAQPAGPCGDTRYSSAEG